jgi:hypothetical protein
VGACAVGMIPGNPTGAFELGSVNALGTGLGLGTMGAGSMGMVLVHGIDRCRVDAIGLRDGGATGTFSGAVVNKCGDGAGRLVDVGRPVEHHGLVMWHVIACCLGAYLCHGLLLHLLLIPELLSVLLSPLLSIL